MARKIILSPFSPYYRKGGCLPLISGMDMREIMAFIIVKVKTINDSAKHAGGGHGVHFGGYFVKSLLGK
jgi:hypothetical protein